jgi:hypothetical protein
MAGRDGRPVKPKMLRPTMTAPARRERKKEVLRRSTLFPIAVWGGL